MKANVIVSITIPVFDKLAYTRACLDALYRNTDSSWNFEVIVVDNGSRDGTAGFLRDAHNRYVGLRVIAKKKNLGFARACNTGAGAARGKYVLFLNNDTEPQAGWLTPLVDIPEHDETVAAVGSKLLYPGLTIQHAGVVILKNTGLDAFPGLTHIYYRQPGNLKEANQTRTYQVLSAACLLVRKDVFTAVGGFDEYYWNGYEDVDLCLEIGRRGGELVYQPRSEVIHHEFASGPERFSKASSNLEYFREKWANTLIPDFTRGRKGPYRLNPHSPIRNYAPAGTVPKTLPLRYLPPDYISADYFLLGEKADAAGNKNLKYYYRKALALLLPKERKTPLETYRIASIYKHLHQYKRSRQWFLKVLAEAKDPTLTAGAYFHLGEMEHHSDQKEKAHSLFLKTVAINPQHNKAREYLKYD